MAHVFTVKSNANRKIRATIEQYRHLTAEDFRINPVEGGFVVVLLAKSEDDKEIAAIRGFDCLEIRRDNAPEEIAEARATAREATDIASEGDELELARKARAAAPKASAGPGKFAAIRAAAERGELPPVPDFSAALHKRNRGRLAQLVAMAKAGDVASLEAFPIKPNCTSPKAMDRYRNLCVVALKARAAAGVSA
jgi:hypothetical protein